MQVPPATQYYISYWLRFSDNFSWGNTSQGGKLPGLAGGGNCSGCSSCSGTNGFSARLMWRPGGKAVLYLYHMDKTSSCGDDHALQVVTGTDFVFQKGQWCQIIERVKINTGSNYNGEVEVWIDQKKALLKTGLKFVSNGDKVDNLYFSTFHGGSDATWAPTVSCTIWFDDIVITTHSTDIFTPTGLVQEKKDNTFMVHPNPSTESVTLQLDKATTEKLRVEVINILGEKIHTEELPEGTAAKQLSIGSIPAGIYFCRLMKENQVVCLQKLIVQ